MFSRTDQSLALARSLPFLCWLFRNLFYSSNKCTRLSVIRKAFVCVNTLIFVLLSSASHSYFCVLILDFSKTMHWGDMLALDLQKYWSIRPLWKKKYLWVHQINLLCHQVNQERYRLTSCRMLHLFRDKKLQRITTFLYRNVHHSLVHQRFSS